jgi:hypothetical protein
VEVIALSASAALTKVPRTGTSTEGVWTELDRATFAVIGYVTPTGEPRSSGVVYKAIGRCLCIAVAGDSWKARHIVTGSTVSVTVPVRRGGVLSLVMPIPPATISFHATAIVYPPGAIDIGSLSPELASLLPLERRSGAVVIELVPEGRFLTYGVGTALMEMRDPVASRAVVPVERSQQGERRNR